jgi:hypothetical protein
MVESVCFDRFHNHLSIIVTIHYTKSGLGREGAINVTQYISLVRIGRCPIVEHSSKKDKNQIKQNRKWLHRENFNRDKVSSDLFLGGT